MLNNDLENFNEVIEHEFRFILVMLGIQHYSISFSSFLF